MRPSRRARRRVGLAMLVLAPLLALPLLVGWVVASTAGTLLPEDAELTWEGDRTYVVSDRGSAVVCTLTSVDGDTTSLATDDDPPRGGWNPLDTHEQLASDGFFLHSPDGPPGTLRCYDDVRVLTGATAWLAAPGEGGLAVVLPVALLVATGGALRRDPSTPGLTMT